MAEIVTTKDNAIATVKTDFYNDQEREYRILTLLQTCLGVIILTTIIFIVIHYPKPVFFNTNDSFQLFQEDSLDIPQFNDAEVLNWIIVTMRELFTFNYINVDQTLEVAQNFFDSRGLQGFYNLIKSNVNFQQVKNNRLIVTNSPLRSPNIVNSQVSGGRYIWEVNLPLRISFENSTFSNSITLNLKMYIVRVPNTEAESGIKITDFQPNITN